MERLVKVTLALILALAGGVVLGWAVLVIPHAFFYKIELPNGYFLQQRWGGAFHIYAPGKLPWKSPMTQGTITQFAVCDQYAYGWIDTAPSKFFWLDTKTGNLRLVEAERELDRLPGVSPLWMRDSITVWDLKTGFKKRAW